MNDVVTLYGKAGDTPAVKRDLRRMKTAVESLERTAYAVDVSNLDAEHRAEFVEQVRHMAASRALLHHLQRCLRRAGGGPIRGSATFSFP